MKPKQISFILSISLIHVPHVASSQWLSLSLRVRVSSVGLGLGLVGLGLGLVVLG